ncbi:MAG: MGMT family protein [Candidatus Omnitrophica bacterium]|nr:MGMT family protein [Candidatus Omnitrophota bacterium]
MKGTGVFRDPGFNRWLREREKAALANPEKGWVNAAMLAWQRHYLHQVKGSGLKGDWRKQCTPFQRKVYEAVLKIPKGEVRTYAQVARMIGDPKAARAVGQALKRNRWAPKIPCHRVIASKFLSRRIPRGIASDGTLGGPASGGTSPGRAAWRLPDKLLGGYSAPGGLAAKRRLLRREGIQRLYF